MEYLIIGAGGTGGSIGGYLAQSGRAVTLVEQPGEHLWALQQKGLTIRRFGGGDYVLPHIRALSAEEYSGRADVIIVCVKGYSLPAVVPLLQRAAGPDTVVIPILNIYGTGAKLAAQLPGLNITDGCMYIAAEISAPGEILHRGDIFRVIFGSREPAGRLPVFDDIVSDLRAAGIDAAAAADIRSAALHKYALVSAMAAAGAFFDVAAGAFQRPGEVRELYVALIREIMALAVAMEVWLREDLIEDILAITDALAPEMTTSMQKDIKKGGESEIDGLVFEPVLLGRRFGVATPQYERVARALGYKD
ncbi:MAG: 2-dehydropantoate 2-reductase [Syntrophomonadaceae bacterium]|nr:2-dehydropantoate 2-reductase [Syntrophomonadaceae bacterium]